MLNPVLIVISVVVFFIILILVIKLAKVHQHNTQLETDLAQTKEKKDLLSNQLRQKYHHNMKLKNELEQERQQNANLESTLTQVNQKTEDFTSKNTPLAGELEQKRQRIANLERKLATSNFSLDQSHQHNERLTGELTQANQQKADLKSDLAQANQRYQRLSTKLEEERQQNANLKNELRQKPEEGQIAQVVSGCSVYHVLIDAIYSANSIETDDQKQEHLWKLRESSRQLGEEYQQPEISPDYSRLDYQEAYLLRYFLPYSQPVPYLLNHLILKKNFRCQLPEDGPLTASFFGCGPGPELFGLMRYLGGPQSDINIYAAMFDIQPAWKHARQIVFKHLLDRVWDPSSYRIQEFESNLVGNAGEFLPTNSEKSVRESDLIVIQHCLNERHNAESEGLIGNLTQLVRKMKSGAVMLIVERARYPSVKGLLGQFCSKLQGEFNSSLNIEIKTQSANGVEIKPILDIIPKELATDFFTEKSSNNSVKFIWMAISKR